MCSAYRQRKGTAFMSRKVENLDSSGPITNPTTVAILRLITFC